MAPSALSNAHAFATARAEVSSAQQHVSTIAARIGRQFGAVVDEAVVEGPNGTLLVRLGFDLGALAAAFERAVAELLRACEAAKEDIRSEERALGVLHAAQEEAHAKLLAHNKDEEGRAKERDALQKRLAKTVNAKRSLELRQAEKVALSARRRELIAKLSALRDKRFEIRKRVARELTDSLTDVRFSVRQAGDDARYRELLTQALSHRPAGVVDDAPKTSGMPFAAPIRSSSTSRKTTSSRASSRPRSPPS